MFLEFHVTYIEFYMFLSGTFEFLLFYVNELFD